MYHLIRGTEATHTESIAIIIVEERDGEFVSVEIVFSKQIL
jgi:hypothetical protein